MFTVRQDAAPRGPSYGNHVRLSSLDPFVREFKSMTEKISCYRTASGLTGILVTKLTIGMVTGKQSNS